MSTHERLTLLGAAQVSEAELLALILGGDDALGRAMDLLAAVGGLWPMQYATARWLSWLPGVDSDGVAAIELAQRAGLRPAAGVGPVGSPDVTA